MDPLELFASQPTALAFSDERGAPQVELVPAQLRDGVLHFRVPHLGRGRAAVARVERSLTTPLDARAFTFWAEARGVLDSTGMRITELTRGAPSLADCEAIERMTILEQLWRRGLPGDDAAIDALRDLHPDTPTPEFLAAPAGFELRCTLTASEKAAAVELLVPTYWNDGLSRARIATAVHGSTVNVGVRERGQLVAHARALCDGAKYAWIYDVIVAPERRGRGLGQALMKLLLEHPRIRGAHQLLLATRDAQALYARFGFRDRREVPSLRPYSSTEMLLRRNF